MVEMMSCRSDLVTRDLTRQLGLALGMTLRFFRGFFLEVNDDNRDFRLDSFYTAGTSFVLPACYLRTL
jgi:hypothetical protein